MQIQRMIHHWRASRQGTLVSVAVIMSSLACDLAMPGETSLSSPRANVVLFLVDDMGVMDTSVPFLTDDEGRPQRYPLNRFYRTPSMQSLADVGIRLNNFYAMSVCSPTRISILTGQNSARHHTTQWISAEENNRGEFGPPDWNWWGLNQQSVTLPRLLKANGYRTIHIGKGHFGPFRSRGADPRNLGFDINIGGRAIGAPGSYSGLDNYRGKKPSGKDRAVPHLDAYHGTNTHLTEALTREAIACVQDAVNSETPFFLYLSHYAVHSPHQADPRFTSHYVGSGKPQRAQNFATLIEGIDRSLGELLEALRRFGVAEKTLVLFLGDNGSDAPLGHEHEVACSAPLRGKKGSHYEGGVRVPFIAAWASPNPTVAIQQEWPIPCGKIQPQMANVCDLLPTICDLTAAETPKDHHLDGSSAWRLLSGVPDPNHSKRFLMHFPHEHRSSYFTTLRDGDWKIAYQHHRIEDAGGDRQQLFNLADDPFEQRNLASSHPVRLRQMMKQMTDSLKLHGAQLPNAPSEQ